MNEQIEIKKQLDGLRERVKFLKDWVAKIKSELDISGDDFFEKTDRIFQLKNEVNHKEYLIKMREHDQEMFKEQRDAIFKKVNTEMDGLIKGLRTKIFPDVKHTKIADGIIKRFSKNSYENMENKIADFRMAEQLLK